MSIEAKLCAYLKEYDFQAFMNAWKKQFERLGRLGGSIDVCLDDHNRECLSGFLGIDYYQQEYAHITWRMVHKAIAQSRFEGADFEIVLKRYFHHQVVSAKFQKEEQEAYIQRLFEQCVEPFATTIAMQWYTHVSEEKEAVYIRMRQEIKQPATFQKHLTWVMHAINELPMWEHQHINMAVFSSHITQDPHAFDQGTFTFYLLFHAICFYTREDYKTVSGMERNRVLMQAGLYRDSISNFCMLAHINAFVKEKHHTGWQGFYERYEIWNVNMQNLYQITALDAASCQCVIIIENPSVFQLLVEQAQKENIQSLGFICTNGQLNVCGYQLLDMVNEINLRMYYCGDMDPEGLLIADKLKQRYETNMYLWHYQMEDYKQAQSDKYADAKRLRMIDKLQDEQLLAIGKELLQQPIGYQENLLNSYRESLTRLIF